MSKGIKLSALYKGRSVESMTRDELIAAVHELGELYTSRLLASSRETDADLHLCSIRGGENRKSRYEG